MALTQVQQNNLKKLLAFLDGGDMALLRFINELDLKVEKLTPDVEAKIAAIRKELATVQDLAQEVLTEAKAKINQPGEPGKDYVLTEEDRLAIAKSIEVPVVKETIVREITVKEQPIVTQEITNEIVEVAVSDTPVVLRDKLETLKDEDRLDVSAIKGIDVKDAKLSEELINRAIGIVDQRTSFLINKLSNLQDKVNNLPTAITPNLNLSVFVVAISGIAANTYNNGSSGVGATLTANANGALQIDGVNISLGDRILLAGETTASHNGVFVATNPGAAGAKYVITRATDADTDAKLRGGSYYIQAGGNNAGKIYANTNTSAITIGTTSITYGNPKTIPAGNTGQLQYNLSGVQTGMSGSSVSGSSLTLGGTLDMGSNPINNITGLNMSNGAGIANLSYINFDGTGGGISNLGDSFMLSGAVLDMGNGTIQNAGNISTTNFTSGNNALFGANSGGGIRVGDNGDVYGIRRESGTDPLEIGYNDPFPGRGVNFFSGSLDFGQVRVYGNGALYADYGSGAMSFYPSGSGFIINGAPNGGATTVLTVSGSNGSGNNAITATGGQAGLIGSGTNGLTSAQGVVGDALFAPSPAAFYAASGTYSFYGSTGILFNAGAIQTNSKITSYNAKTTTGWGVPAIYGTGRQTAKTVAQTNFTTYTVGAADGSFLVSANVNVTTATAHSFTVTVGYTDETNTARTLTLNFSNLAGTFLTTITNLTGAGPYEGVPTHIRCKASTAINISTVGTFTTVTYNVEGSITQIA